jgi:putative membrane protein
VTETGTAPGKMRLHPATPLLRGFRMFAVVVAAISWQGYAQLGFLRWLGLVAVLLVVVLAIAAVSWLVTGYQIVGRELRVSEGLLWRRTRAIPLERLQAVDVVRPLLARLLGVAELRLEVVGAHKTEAPLAYLSLRDAERLRVYLLALSAGVRDAAATGAGIEAAEPAPAPVGERLVHTVDNRRVLLAQLLTPHALTLPVFLLLTVLPYAQERRWSFVAVGSLLTAVVGVVQVPARRVLDEWHFRIGADADGLRLHHGLLDTRNQTVPPQRVQAIEVLWPLLWRMVGWVRARIDVAGYGAHDRGAGIRAGVLLPVADPETARRVAYEVLGVDVAALPLAPPPKRARWLAPLRWPHLGFGVTDTVVATSDGWPGRRLAVVPLTRVQSVRVVQGPVQRALGLATVHVDTAGALHAVGDHRDAAEAYSLAAALASASRSARAAERSAAGWPAVRAPHQRSTAPTRSQVNPT